jgi:hypothetical protein
MPKHVLTLNMQWSKGFNTGGTQGSNETQPTSLDSMLQSEFMLHSTLGVPM